MTEIVVNRETYYCKSMLELLKYLNIIEEHTDCKNNVYAAIDCEWTQKTCLSLLQISFIFDSRIISLLVHFTYMDHMPEKFEILLNKKNIIIYGFAFGNDIRQFNRINYHNNWMDNVIDIQQKCGELLFKNQPGLEQSVKEILGINLSKNKKITCSNWDIEGLSMSQLLYSSNDSVYTLYLALKCFYNIKILDLTNDDKIKILNTNSDCVCWYYLRHRQCKYEHNCNKTHDLEFYFLIMKNSICIKNMQRGCKNKDCQYTHLE